MMANQGHHLLFLPTDMRETYSFTLPLTKVTTSWPLLITKSAVRTSSKIVVNILTPK